MKTLIQFPPFFSPFSAGRFFPAAIAPLLLIAAFSVQAQSFCASDGQPRPSQLMERFINADCASCWTDPATPKPNAGQIALDWVIPGSQGDDAPLSAVATRDGLSRLESLHKPVPAGARSLVLPIKNVRGSSLRVAHGLPVNDYIGASIELKPIPGAVKNKTWSAWLALVETLPAGTEGSPTERNLVRNLLQTDWKGHTLPAGSDQNRFFDARSMSLPKGANPEHLRVIGWVEDETGQILAAAASRCEVP